MLIQVLLIIFLKFDYMKKILLISSVVLLNCQIAISQTSLKQSNNLTIEQFSPQDKIIPGAERINVYLPLIKGKKVGIFANHTSTVGKGHLVDTLQKLGVDIRVIFGPEHGFRGTIPDGVKIADYKDEKTGIPVVSLYGAKRRPTADDIKDVDVLIFDIQDVGTRFYTYISSMQEFLEFALENHKPLMILDRPNPNGFYVDGPVLDPKFKSFVGIISEDRKYSAIPRSVSARSCGRCGFVVISLSNNGMLLNSRSHRVRLPVIEMRKVRQAFTSSTRTIR